MLTIGALLFLVAVTTLFSLREKARQIRLRDMEGERSSPFSRALSELVGTAGGIYLSLNLARDFLKLDVPARVALWHLEMEPLAVLALSLALLQPYVLRFYHGLRR